MIFKQSTLEFEGGNQALALEGVAPDAAMADVLEALKLPEFCGVVTLVVAAGSMPQEIIEASRELFSKSLAPLAEKLGLLVVDGATHVGGVLAMGDARKAVGGTFPLVGVIPQGVIKVPDDLNASHSHFVLVDGNRFGDESQILPGFLQATDKPGAVIIVNCRLNSNYLPSEFPLHMQWADRIIPIRHSGGVADAMLDTESELYQSLSPDAQKKIKGADLNKPEELYQLLEELFTR